MQWTQHSLQPTPRRRGFHHIPDEILQALPELSTVAIGVLHVFLQHTSASLTISENADPDVPADLESSFNALAPESFPHRHTIEGPDDMPAHVRNCLLGSSVSVPVGNGRLLLGTCSAVLPTSIDVVRQTSFVGTQASLRPAPYPLRSQVALKGHFQAVLARR